MPYFVLHIMSESFQPEDQPKKRRPRIGHSSFHKKEGTPQRTFSHKNPPEEKSVRKSYNTDDLLRNKEKRESSGGKSWTQRKSTKDFDSGQKRKHERDKPADRTRSSFKGKPTSRKKTERHTPSKTEPEFIRLNKYIADAGVCSRREADKLIEAAEVSVNGKIITELGTKVSIHDKVMYKGQTLRRERLRYVLLNKPKDYITTSDDPHDRKTVMDLVRNACNERIYPVGRLDRNTIGLLLLTNDGELAKVLTHPKHRVKKLYHVFLDKNLTKNDLLRIAEGVELEDGKAEVDAITYVAGVESKKEIGVQLHSGKNRVVRRIF